MHCAPAEAAAAARPEQPALHIKRPNEGRGDEEDGMQPHAPWSGSEIRRRRWPAAVVHRRRLRRRTSMARLG